MFDKKPLTMAVSAAVGAAFAMGMAPANAQEEQLVEEVVVTGSRIQRANLVSSSPVTQLDAEQLRFTGLTRVEDALAAIPAISLDQSSGQAIEATGTATLQLRNLGSQRTLVLMNGRRLPANSPNSPSNAADINLIPGQLIERVEVLTGGASSTYGADAVAGVVNFIMMDDFEGVRIDFQGGQYRADNDGGLVAGAAERAGQPFATGTATDGDQYDITAIMGGNFDNGRGNATAFLTYRDIEGVTQLNRDTSACPVRNSGECLGSGTNQSGSWIVGGENYRTEGTEWLEGRGPGFNFAAPSFFQRPDRRTTMGTFAHYDVNEHVEAYTELMFMDTKSDTQFGPSGVFFQTFDDLNCNNPLLSAQQLGVTGCTSPDDRYSATLGRRNVEGGPRKGSLRHTTYRGVFGLRGDINDTWRYDVSYQYAEVNMTNRNTNYVDLIRIEEALNAVQLDDGSIGCESGNGACVPYNVFQTGGVTDEATAYFSQSVYENGRTTQEVMMGYVQGSLGDYGIVSPFAENGIEVVAGAEYREESLTYNLSDNAARGDAGGFGVPVPVDGRYDVSEIYFEASVPVLEDAPFVQALVLDLGYRYSDYSTGTTTNTYKIAASWDINDDIKVRGSYQRAVRAPNIVDLFEPESAGLFAMDRDPCLKASDGANVSLSGYSFEQCARSGVSQAIWDRGGPENSPAAQYNSTGGGSTTLDPEEADTYSFGAIWQPSFVEGLQLSVDYYEIEITGAIQGIQEETTLLQCIETGDATFCDQINRGQLDTLWLGQSSPTNGINAASTNIGFLRVEGVDVEINYNFDIGDMGTVSIANIAGFVLAFDQEEYPGAGVVNCEGTYGGSCQIPTPDLKNRFQATWATPWNVNANLIWRHVAGSTQEFTDAPNDIDDVNYFDIAATWAVTDSATLRFGINNVLDEDPPFVYQGVTARENGNTYPGIYDPLGQYWFLGGTLQF
ncbi:MAG: iron complex outermembrane receptor protein [Glaciecola sp.]|jgi:iron complex outermembrane receptor protein|uniref:TonB-dependent receptor domain-containing protein n=1 Tax=Congregibacter sp. TaxID=2744308 RepID=UPI0039E2DF3B